MSMNINRIREMQIREIKSLVALSEFDGIIDQIFDFIKTNFRDKLTVVVAITDESLIQEEVIERAKIEWELPESRLPRIPRRVVIDGKNLKGLSFLFTLLHEFGHLEDYNNPDIKLKTKKSEISAWKNCYEKLKTGPNFNDISDSFFCSVKNSLETYGVNFTDGEELIQIDLTDVKD